MNQFLFILLILFINYSSSASSGKCGTDCSFSIDTNNKLLRINGNGAMDNFEANNAPWSDNALNIEKIEIEEGITTIGSFAFDNFTNLLNVSFGYDVTIIGEQAFANCKSMKEITITKNIEFIDNFAFVGCTSLKLIKIASESLLLRGGIFWGCTSLSSIEYYGNKEPQFYDENICSFDNLGCGNNDNPINCSPFYCQVNSLVDISVPFNYETESFCGKSIVRRNEEQNHEITGSCGNDCQFVFNEITKELTINGNNEMNNFEKNMAPWFDYKSKIEKVTIKEGITSIGSFAFYSCINLKSVSIPNTITTIGKESFYECQSLKQIIIPESIETIDDYAFTQCINLKEVIIASQNIQIGSGVFWKCPSLTTIQYYGKSEPTYKNTMDCHFSEIECGSENSKINCSPFYCGSQQSKNIIVPNDYQSQSFCEETSLTFTENMISTVSGNCGSTCEWKFNKITNEMTISGEGEMNNYQHHKTPWENYRLNIESVIIEEGITTIGSYAFQDCQQLKTVSFGDSVESIKEYAFDSCLLLEEINIPESVESIEQYAFSRCKILKNIIIDSIKLTFGNSVFWECSSLHHVEYYGLDNLNYNNDATCFAEDIGCGTKDSPISCSPFYCGTEYLHHIKVPFDYKGNYFVGETISRQIENTEEECKDSEDAKGYLIVNHGVGVHIVLEIGKCYEIETQFNSLFSNRYGTMKVIETKYDIQLCIYDHDLGCYPIESIIGTFKKYNEKEQYPEHFGHATLGCEDIEKKPILLFLESNCFEIESNIYSQISFNSENVEQSYYKDEKCKEKLNDMQNKNTKCETCSENGLMIHCDDIKRNNNSTVIIAIVVVIVVLIVVIIIVCVVFFIVYKKKSLILKKKEQISSEMNLEYLRIDNDELNNDNSEEYGEFPEANDNEIPFNFDGEEENNNDKF